MWESLAVTSALGHLSTRERAAVQTTDILFTAAVLECNQESALRRFWLGLGEALIPAGRVAVSARSSVSASGFAAPCYRVQATPGSQAGHRPRVPHPEVQASV